MSRRKKTSLMQCFKSFVYIVPPYFIKTVFGAFFDYALAIIAYFVPAHIGIFLWLGVRYIKKDKTEIAISVFCSPGSVKCFWVVNIFMLLADTCFQRKCGTPVCHYLHCGKTARKQGFRFVCHGKRCIVMVKLFVAYTLLFF